MKCRSCRHTWYTNFLPKCPKCGDLEGYDDERFNMETKREDSIPIPESLKDWFKKMKPHRDMKE